MNIDLEVFVRILIFCLIFGFLFSISFGRIFAGVFFKKEPKTSIPNIVVGWIFVFILHMFLDDWSFSKISLSFCLGFLASALLFYIIGDMLGSK